MSIKSDVALVMRKEFFKKLKENSSKSVLKFINSADTAKINTKDVFFYWDSINWHIDFDEYNSSELMKSIKKVEEKYTNSDNDYYMLILTSEIITESSPIETYGNLFDSDFYPSISTKIEFKY